MITISLTYSCGCVWTDEVSQLANGETAEHTIDLPCVPEDCPSCIAHGRPCPSREGLYRPVDFADIPPMPRRGRRTRIKNTGTRAWE